MLVLGSWLTAGLSHGPDDCDNAGAECPAPRARPSPDGAPHRGTAFRDDPMSLFRRPSSLPTFVVPLLALALVAPASATPAPHRDRHGDSRIDSRWHRADETVLTLRSRHLRPVIFLVSVGDDRHRPSEIALVNRRGQERHRLRIGPVRGHRTVDVVVRATRHAERHRSGRFGHRHERYRGPRRHDRIATGRVHVVVVDARRPDRRLEHYHRDVRIRLDDEYRRRDRDHDHGDDCRCDSCRDGRYRGDRRWRHDRSHVRPSGYETLLRTSVARLPSERPPVAVRAGDRRFARAVADAIAVWNDAAALAGVSRPFVAAARPERAEIILDWSGRGMPSRRGGTTAYERDGASLFVERVALHPDLDPGDPRTVRIVAHELGHVLGLGHSTAVDDLMHESVHRDRHGRRGEVRATPRDVDMLAWLHEQPADVTVRFGDGVGAWPVAGEPTARLTR